VDDRYFDGSIDVTARAVGSPNSRTVMTSCTRPGRPINRRVGPNDAYARNNREIAMQSNVITRNHPLTLGACQWDDTLATWGWILPITRRSEVAIRETPDQQQLTIPQMLNRFD